MAKADKSQRRKAGRPAGAKTAKNPATVTVSASRCPSCGSTEREKYHRTDETPYCGPPRDDGPATHLVRRWTRCLSCGQNRIDRFYENRTGSVEPVTFPFPAFAAAAAETPPEAIEARPAA
jgi:hypothetical protein